MLIRFSHALWLALAMARKSRHVLWLILCLFGAVVGPARASDEAPIPIQIDGLQRPVSLWWDTNGVPHIDAESLHDAVVLQGYACATERLFQIDHLRSISLGRMAELHGLRYVLFDRVFRRLQLGSVARSLLDGATPRTRELIEAYAIGVNAYMDQVRAGKAVLSPEYADLALDIEDLRPWTAEDSGAVAALYMFVLSSPLIPELFYGLPELALGSGIAQDLNRQAPAAPTPIIEPGEWMGSGRPGAGAETVEARQAAEAEVAAMDMDPKWIRRIWQAWQMIYDVSGILPPGRNYASNNWVVGPSLTASGHPLLANDPHLDAQAYDQAFLVRARCGEEGEFTGGSFSGIPGIIFGHTDHHAMGFTALNADNVDLFLESCPVPGFATLHGGRLVPIERNEETYRANMGGEIRDCTDVFFDGDTYTVPHHGPVILWGPLRASALTVKWAGYRPNNELDSFIDAMMAESLDDYVAAVETREVLTTNAVYADTAGHIHYSAHLRYPIRRFSDLVPPWSIRPGGGLFDWNGSLPLEDQPHLLDPARGWIATANNDPLGLTFGNDVMGEEIYHGLSYATGFRSERIASLVDSLSADHPLTLDDMARIQADTAWLLAGRFVPHLVEAARVRPDLLTDETRGLVRRLGEWDLGTGIHRTEPAIFHVWFSHLATSVLSDDAGLIYEVVGGSDFASRGLLFVLENPEQAVTGERIFDDPATADVESREEALLAALDAALETLAARFDTRDPDAWPWGDMHTVTYSHPFGGDYNLPADGSGFPLDGGAFTVDVASTGTDPQDASAPHIPVLRFVASLEPEGIEAWWMLASGNGGPGGQHYGDQIPDYLENRYFRVTDDPATMEGSLVRFLP